MNLVDRDKGVAVIEGDADDASVIATIKAEGYEASVIKSNGQVVKGS